MLLGTYSYWKSFMCKDLLALFNYQFKPKGFYFRYRSLSKDVSAFLNSNFKPLVVQTKHLPENVSRLFQWNWSRRWNKGHKYLSGRIGTQKRPLNALFFSNSYILKAITLTSLLIEKILQYLTNLDYRELQDMIPEDVLIYVIHRIRNDKSKVQWLISFYKSIT